MHHQMALPLSHRTALGDQDFLVSDCNVDAVGWVDRWPDWPAPLLVVHGPPGCGKSHLIAVWAKRARARLAVLADGELPDLSTATGKPLAVDGLDRIAGDRTREEALFHIYNGATPVTGLMLTSRVPPGRLDFALPDLASRVRGAPTARIAEPDDTLLIAIMAKQFQDRQVMVDEGVLDYLLQRMVRSFEEARTLVAALDNAAMAGGKGRITRPIARRVLNDLYPGA